MNHSRRHLKCAAILYPSRVESSEHQVHDIAQREELPLAALEGRSDERLEGVADEVAFALDQAVLLELAYNAGDGAVVCIIASLRSTAMSTGYPSSWSHPTTQVIDDTIYTRTHPTAKPCHTLARPGHCLVRVLLPHTKSANTPTSRAA